MAEDLITVSVEGGRAPLQVHRSSQQLRAGGEGVRGLTATHGSLVLALLDAGEPLSEAQLVLAMGELRGRAVSGKRIGRWASEINVAVRRTAVRADPLGYPAGGPYRLRLLKPTGDVSGTDAAEARDTALTAGLVAAIREAAAAGERAIYVHCLDGFGFKFALAALRGDPAFAFLDAPPPPWSAAPKSRAEGVLVTQSDMPLGPGWHRLFIPRLTQGQAAHQLEGRFGDEAAVNLLNHLGDGLPIYVRRPMTGPAHAHLGAYTAAVLSRWDYRAPPPGPAAGRFPTRWAASFGHLRSDTRRVLATLALLPFGTRLPAELPEQMVHAIAGFDDAEGWSAVQSEAAIWFRRRDRGWFTLARPLFVAMWELSESPADRGLAEQVLARLCLPDVQAAFLATRGGAERLRWTAVAARAIAHQPVAHDDEPGEAPPLTKAALARVDALARFIRSMCQGYPRTFRGGGSPAFLVQQRLLALAKFDRERAVIRPALREEREIGEYRSALRSKIGGSMWGLVGDRARRLRAPPPREPLEFIAPGESGRRIDDAVMQTGRLYLLDRTGIPWRATRHVHGEAGASWVATAYPGASPPVGAGTFAVDLDGERSVHASADGRLHASWCESPADVRGVCRTLIWAGRRIFTGTDDGRVGEWADGPPLRLDGLVGLAPAHGRVLALAAPRPGLLYSGHESGAVWRWIRRDETGWEGEVVGEMDWDRLCLALTTTDDGSAVYAAYSDGRVRRFVHGETPEVVAEPRTRIRGLALVHANGRAHIATGGDDGVLCLWALGGEGSATSPVLAFEAHLGSIRRLSAHGSHLASVSEDGTVRVWHLDRFRRNRPYQLSMSNRTVSARERPDGTLDADAALANGPGTSFQLYDGKRVGVEEIDWSGGSPVPCDKGHVVEVAGSPPLWLPTYAEVARISPDGRRLAVIDRAGRLWMLRRERVDGAV